MIGLMKFFNYLHLVILGSEVLLTVSQVVLVVPLVDLGISMKNEFLVIPNYRHFLLIFAVRMDALHTFCFIIFAMRLKGPLFFISKLLLMYTN
jgi:hypothetical protein